MSLTELERIDLGAPPSSVGSPNPTGVRRAVEWVTGVRLSAWLALSWIGLSVAWLISRVLNLARCPLGQQGCVQTPELGPGQIAPFAFNLAVIAVMFIGLWLWDRHRSSGEVAAQDANTDGAPESGAEAPDAQPNAARDAARASGRFAQWRWRPVRVTITATVAILVTANVLLLAPMETEVFCADPIYVNRHMAYPYNCDSYAFTQLAHAPSTLLMEGNARQSRPGYVYLAAGLVKMIGPATQSLGLDELYGQDDSAYIPLVLMNLAVAVLAVVLLTWLVRGFGATRSIALSLGGLLLISGVTKAFFWTAHQQMFSYLVPIATVAILRWLILRRPTWPFILLLGLLVGLASLVYGSFVITLAAVPLVLLARGVRGIVPAGLFVAGFAAPNISWIQYCKSYAGSYFNNELELYDQFIWLPKSASEGIRPLYYYVETLATAAMRNIMHVGLIPILVLFGLAAVSVVVRARTAPSTREEHATLVATVLTVILSLLFVFGIGHMADRLAFTVIPALLILIGWFAARLARHSRTGFAWSHAILAFAVASSLFYQLTTHGPYA